MRIQLIENVNEGTVDYNMQLWFFFLFENTCGKHESSNFIASTYGNKEGVIIYFAQE